MRPSRMLAVFFAASGTSAAYTGDIVQYWIDQSSICINGTIVNGLQTPPSAWALAITSASMYKAAVKTEGKSLEFRQIAVSHAAHNTLAWIFHGTRLYPLIDGAMKTIQTQILATGASFNQKDAIAIGRRAALEEVRSRTDDGITDFVDYQPGPPVPGVYQITTANYTLPPDDPQIPYVKLFAIRKPAIAYLAPPPPNVTDASYEGYVTYVKAIGGANSTTRTQDQTEIALFWRESAPIKWNRIANAMVGNSLAKDISKSAKLRTQLNYAMTNGAITAWVSKFHYEAWRPETAIRRTDVWLSSGHNVSDPTWTPLIFPTPIEQDYTSGHGTVGGAAAAVLKAFNGGDDVNITVSALVTQAPQVVLTRHITNITAAGYEIGMSRVYGGIHYVFSAMTGVDIGMQVGRDTVAQVV